MAQRALTFKVGTQGMLCAATEIEFESATETRKSVTRIVRTCTNLATVVWKNTSFCEDCASQIVLSGGDMYVIDRIERRP
jgi:hypothetical protein